MSLRPRGEEWSDAEKPKAPASGSANGLSTGNFSAARPFQSKHQAPPKPVAGGGSDADKVLEAVVRGTTILPELIRLHKLASSAVEGTPEFEQHAQEYADYLQDIVMRESGRVLALLISAGIASMEELNDTKGNN